MRAAESGGGRVPLEDLDDARTPLADFFSILIMSGWAAGRWPAAATSTIGGTVAETGEADGDGGAFARRTADGN